MALPVFDAEARCPKCGHDDVRVTYIADHPSYSTPRCGARYEDFKHMEHFDRSCARCHYEWAEAILEHDGRSGLRGEG